jgi:hypothetical protein
LNRQTFQNEIYGYFEGKYNDWLRESIDTFIRSIAEPDLDKLLDILKERNEAKKISIKQIIEACRIGSISFHEPLEFKPESRTCDCCGHNFKYIPMATDEDKIDRDVHDRCPVCGFFVSWTLSRSGYIKYDGYYYAEEWYKSMIVHFTDYMKDHDRPWFDKVAILKEQAEQKIVAREALKVSIFGKDISMTVQKSDIERKEAMK